MPRTAQAIVTKYGRQPAIVAACGLAGSYSTGTRWPTVWRGAGVSTASVNVTSPSLARKRTIGAHMVCWPLSSSTCSLWIAATMPCAFFHEPSRRATCT